MPASSLEARLADFVHMLPKPAHLASMDKRLKEGAPRLLALGHLATMDRFKLEALCRAQAQPLYLGDHLAICRILGRYKLFVDTHDCGFAAHVLLDGYWEMWLTIFMCRRIRPGMIVMDVGANFGYYTLLLADLVGPQGRVFAIDPNPDVAALLRRSVALNGFAERTSIVEAAAGAKPAGQGLLYSPHGEFKNACVIESPDQVDPAAGTIHQVRQVTIDDVVSAAPRLDFLKIDAEGAEEAIVEGMESCLHDHKPSFILEFNAARCRDPGALIRRLTAIYGTVCYLNFGGCLTKTTEAELTSQHVGQDWLLFFDHETAVP